MSLQDTLATSLIGEVHCCSEIDTVWFRYLLKAALHTCGYHFIKSVIQTGFDLISTEEDNPHKESSGSHWRPTPSQIASAKIDFFRPLSVDECETRRKWRAAALVFYALVTIFAVLASLAIGPPGQTATKNNPAYSAIASRGHNNSR